MVFCWLHTHQKICNSLFVYLHLSLWKNTFLCDFISGVSLSVYANFQILFLEGIALKCTPNGALQFRSDKGDH
jgi:hypothetical protein